MLKVPVEKRELGITIIPGKGAGMLFWSPQASSAEIEVKGKGNFPLSKTDYGYWEGTLPGVCSSDRYLVVIDRNKKVPDPVSLSQPDGVHGASEVIDTSWFPPEIRGWSGIKPADLIIYELHTGTFTREGNFEGVAGKLDYLCELGINAIELMPVAQFPGSRNWGYDGAFPFAVQNSYGGPAGFAKLVNECHRRGIAVILDVVYNHIGPEGNYLPVAGPYFTEKYSTPWGKAINFDDEWCDGVRRYFIENALMWLRDFRVDGLRLDAVHAIRDFSAVHFLAELSESVIKLNRLTGRDHFLIGECDLNDSRYITPASQGGLGLDAQWCDEFHHAIHSRITGEKNGYYSDFGKTSQLVDSFNNAYVYNGRYSEHRKKLFGSSTEGFPGNRFVVFIQNHDQTGNRMLGERLNALTDFETLKLSAGAMFTSPYIPMLFMGEEYGEDAPFLYFTSHGDPGLAEAVREGRKREFESFIKGREAPDPQSEETFKRSVLSWNFAGNEKKEKLLDLYKKLISLKREHPAFKPGKRDNIVAAEAAGGKAIVLTINYSETCKDDINNQVETDHPLSNNPEFSHVDNGNITVLMNFSEELTEIPIAAGASTTFRIIIYSAHQKWGGPVSEFASLTDNGGAVILAPRSFLILADR